MNRCNKCRSANIKIRLYNKENLSIFTYICNICGTKEVKEYKRDGAKYLIKNGEIVDRIFQRHN